MSSYAGKTKGEDSSGPSSYGGNGPYAPLSGSSEVVGESAPLLATITMSTASSVAGFNYDANRPAQDRMWSWVFAVCFIVCVSMGIHGATNVNPRYRDAFTKDFMSDPANCPAEPSRRMLIENEPPQIDPHVFGKAAAAALVASSAASVALGLMLVKAAERNAHAMLNFAAGTQVALPAFAAVLNLIAGNVVGAVIFGLFALFMGWLMNRWRHFFDLCARLISVAATALTNNPMLVPVVLLPKLGGLLVVLPMITLMVVSLTNGHIVPNPYVDSSGTGGVCQNAEGTDVPCCMWEVKPWVNAYFALGSIFCLWTMMIVFEMRTFVTASVATQWYYQPVGSPPLGNSAITRAVGHAFGPSFGSVTYGGLILTWVQIMKDAANKMQRERNIFSILLGCIMACLLELIEFLTKFATIRCAVTGEAFCEAARNATDLLKRNLLPTVGVWYFPPMVLGLFSFILSVVCAVAAFFVARFSFEGELSLVLTESILLAFFVFFIVLVGVSFFANLLLSVVDAVFMCYASDKDRSVVTHVEIHDVFQAVPMSTMPGPVISQPDGEIGYGRPVEGERAV